MTLSDPSARGLPDERKVLEVGETGLFYWGMRHRTESYYASYRADLLQERRFLGLRALYRIARAARRGEYALVVLHPPLYPGWHWRSFLAAFKYTVFKGNICALYGAIVSPLAFALLRFVPMRPLVAIDRSDSRTIQRHHVFLLDRAAAYFKRELPVDHWQAFMGTAHRTLPGAAFRRRRRWRERVARLKPIGLGISAENAIVAAAAYGQPKTVDVFFSGTIEGNSSVRAQIRGLIDQLVAAGVTVDAPDDRMEFDEFLQRCGRAWLTLSPEGLGWDCYRHVEAAIAGSVPIVNAPTIDRYHPLVVDRHCIVYHPDEYRLVEIVTGALADKDRLRTMAAAAHEHAMKFLTLPAICADILARYGDRPENGNSVAGDGGGRQQSAPARIEP